VSAAPPGAVVQSCAVASWDPAYLVHGDDHGRIGERRASLRDRAEAETGAGGVEAMEGDAATPEAVALALSAMTFAMGRRFIVVDGVERWKDADLGPLLPVLADMPPETTVAFFAREDGRVKAPAKLAKAVEKAGGRVLPEQLLKGRELPRWAIGQASKLGVTLENAAAQALVAAVGERQQRLLRELEKLALEHGEGARIGVEEVEAAAAPSAERQVWPLVDALVARDERTGVRVLLELRAQGEALPRLVPLMARRVREVLAIAERLEAGEAPAQIKGTLRMAPFAADRRIKEARGADAASLRRSLEALAHLELAGRGGSELAPDTEALRALAVMTG
jgi:DNA polymerase III subunit delta